MGARIRDNMQQKYIESVYKVVRDYDIKPRNYERNILTSTLKKIKLVLTHSTMAMHREHQFL
jgi:hypothetical protein